MSDWRRMLRDRYKVGCGDNSCIFGSPGGMATNGGCRCFDSPNREHLRAIRFSVSASFNRIHDLEAALVAADEMRSQLYMRCDQKIPDVANKIAAYDLARKASKEGK